MKSDFVIGTTKFSTGGRLGICGLPRLKSLLSDDLGTILDWRPTIVVSMTELQEMQSANCGKLGSVLQEFGIEWIHLPVRDFGGLTDDNLIRWPLLSSHLHQCLNSGGGVLVHCKGGHGRSGMIALRLMIERGELPEIALKKLRTIRPGAVESDEQYAWAALAMAKK